VCGRFLEEDIDVIQNHRSTALFDESVALSGNSESELRDGRMLEDGRGAKQKIDKVIHDHALAGSNGHDESRQQLSALKCDGL
jgi:hypothetical protein